MGMYGKKSSPILTQTPEEYEAEINRLRYQINYQRQQKDELAKQLKKVRSSRSYRLASKFRRLYSIWLGSLHTVSWPVRRFQAVIKKQRDAKESKRLAALHKEIKFKSAELPVSNGMRYYKKFDLRVAIITDEFMYNYYKDAFKEVYWLTPENWESVFSENDINLFLYVSCWQGGLNAEWRGHMRNPHHLSILDNILELCVRNKIKAIFQSIEDPSNFKHFLPLAKRFKYILTSDADIISEYQRECPGCIVIHAEYGINPVMNNPIGMFRDRKHDAFFAGSYPTRYRQRCEDMKIIFDSVLKSSLSLSIADRNLDRNISGYQFPAEYASYVISPFSHETLQAVHKLFWFNVNLNSIKRSSTMCAMRVYELQAQGEELISNYSKSISNLFPGITIISHPKDLAPLFKRRHEPLSYEKRIRAVRRIMSNKTVFDQVFRLLRSIDFKIGEPYRPKVLIVSDDCSDQKGLRGLENVELFYVVRNDFNTDSLTKYDYVAFFSNEYEYDEFYLLDMLNAFKYTNVPFVTRDSYFVNGEKVNGREHEYIDGVPILNRTVYSIGCNHESLLAHLKSGLSLGKGYSVDCFGIGFEEHLNRNTMPVEIRQPLLTVVIPVFENGEFLYERAFESLRMNERFDEFEVLIIDDCSSDPHTLEVLDKLRRRYKNVLVHRLEGGPSGSASRPRNIGIDLGQGKYITFLDPDNAISPGAYDLLLETAIKRSELDAVFGYQIKVTSQRVRSIGRLFDKSFVLVQNPKNDIVLEKSFPVISTQAAVLKKDIFANSDVRFIEGAVGQDTAFGYLVLLASSQVCFIHGAYLEYYAERNGSVTNLIGREFFEKSLILERAQKDLLEKYDVWGHYIKYRSRGFIEGWYLEKFKMVRDEEWQICADLLSQIAEINHYRLDFKEFTR